jgi:hypothetical protein
VKQVTIRPHRRDPVSDATMQSLSQGERLGWGDDLVEFGFCMEALFSKIDSVVADCDKEFGRNKVKVGKVLEENKK